MQVFLPSFAFCIPSICLIMGTCALYVFLSIVEHFDFPKHSTSALLLLTALQLVHGSVRNVLTSSSSSPSPSAAFSAIRRLRAGRPSSSSDSSTIINSQIIQVMFTSSSHHFAEHKLPETARYSWHSTKLTQAVPLPPLIFNGKKHQFLQQNNNKNCKASSQCLPFFVRQRRYFQERENLFIWQWRKTLIWQWHTPLKFTTKEEKNHKALYNKDKMWQPAF